MHPVTSITIIPTESENTSVPTFTGVTQYPNPANDHITFKLNDKPDSPVFITSQDAVGRLAWQYQRWEF